MVLVSSPPEYRSTTLPLDLGAAAVAAADDDDEDESGRRASNVDEAPTTTARVAVAAVTERRAAAEVVARRVSMVSRSSQGWGGEGSQQPRWAVGVASVQA